MSEQHKATEVRDELTRLENQDYDDIITDYTKSVEGIMREIVETGSFVPENALQATLNLSLRERVTGTREQDMTAVFATGLMLGAALERDIPIDSDIETEWRNKNMELPDEDTNTDAGADEDGSEQMNDTE